VAAYDNDAADQMLNPSHAQADKIFCSKRNIRQYDAISVIVIVLELLFSVPAALGHRTRKPWIPETVTDVMHASQCLRRASAHSSYLDPQPSTALTLWVLS